MPFHYVPEDRKKAFRNRYIRRHVAMLYIGLLSAFAGVAFLLNPSAANHSAIQQTVGGNLAYFWYVLYLIGGLIVVWSIVQPRLRVEFVGVCLLAIAVLTNGIALMAVFGVGGLFAASVYIFGLATFYLRAREIQYQLKHIDEELEAFRKFVREHTGGHA